MKSNDAQEQLQEILVKTYFSNINFIKDCDEELYKRISNLSLAIEQGIYKERYHLEFIKEQGEFDLFDSHTNSYIYNQKPKQFINRSVNSIDFDKKGSISIFEPIYFSTQQKLSNIVVYKNEIQDQKLGTLKLTKDIRAYLNELKVNIQDAKKYKSIDKFMFIGTLLGRHIPSLIKKIKAKQYFVHEPNLEIFRLSLFVLDYTLFLSNGASVKFSIMEEPPLLEKKLYNYYLVNIWENHTIKFHTTDYNVIQSFESVVNSILPAKPTLYGYNMMLYCVIRNLAQRTNKYNFLYFPLKESLDKIQQKPILYLCAGPSLEDNIAWIRQHKDKFIIATIGAAYKKLISQDIQPDIIFSLDGDYSLLNKLQFDEQSVQKIQDCIVIASCHTAERILKRFNPKRFYLYETMLSFKPKSVPLKGHSVGEIGYKILLEMGAKKLYLLGTDLAIDQEKGSTHSADSGSTIKIFDLKNMSTDVERNAFNLSEDLVKVKGNLQPEVYTTRILNTSLLDYSRIEKKPWQEVFNLCNHGAYIYNTIPMSIENIDMTQFQVFKTNQQEFLNQFNEEVKAASTSKLNKEEMDFLEEMYHEIEMIKNDVNNFQSKNYDFYEAFKEDCIELLKKVFHVKEKFSNQSFSVIVSLFFATINSYIDYVFNTPKIKNEKKKINKVAQLWFGDFKTIIEDFQIYLQQVIK